MGGHSHIGRTELGNVPSVPEFHEFHEFHGISRNFTNFTNFTISQGVFSQPVIGYARGTVQNYIAPPLLTFLSFAVPGALSAGGPDVAASLGTAVVSAGTKAAAREAVEGAATTAAQKAAVKRAIARATASEKVSVERLADGSVRVLRSRPGADGYQVFSTIVGQDGVSNVVQVGVSATGEVTHYDPK